VCTAAHSVWYFILHPAFLVEISVRLATLRRGVQLVWVSPKAGMMLKNLKESSVYESSQVICLVIKFLWGDLDLKSRTGLESRTGHETQWPLDPKERWCSTGKCEPPGS